MTIGAKFNLDIVINQTKGLAKDFEAAISRSLDALADELLKEIKRTAPRKTGDYAKSWRKGRKTKNSIQLETPKQMLYLILEFTGRRPGRIYGNPTLVFEIDGKKIFARSVMHPGFKAIPHIRPALRKITQSAPKIIHKEMQKIPIFKR